MEIILSVGKKLFNERLDVSNLIKEMNTVDVVKNLRAFKKSKAKK